MDDPLERVATIPSPLLRGRQLDCMLLVKKGLSSKQIARELGISSRTVDQHIAAAMDSMGVANRMAAVSLLYELDRGADEAAAVRSVSLVDLHSLSPPFPYSRETDTHTPAILPPLGGQPNRASRSIRITWIVRIAIFCVMITAVGILSILAATHLFSGADQ